jgi:tRNA nucleotidyltransferase/poly(A) polymerase
MDEIHANLQHDGNKICPCAIVHEGYEEDFVKRKKLKNIHYFASSSLSYEELWEVIFDYVNKKYDIDKFKTIFISGDGASGIKSYNNCFPNAKFVLDPFHYVKKHLKYIFKNETDLKNIADDYIRNDLIDDFKTLVKYQIEKYPEQEKYMKEHMNYIINNLDGIKNQQDENYKVHCSMEGHINQGFARYITSSPYGFSEQGLENKLKLLVYHANKHELTIEDYYNLKYGNNYYEDINIKINKLKNIKYDQKLSSNHQTEYTINTAIPILDSSINNNQLKELLSLRQEIYII